MNERDYGVGIANRYALFMGEEGSDPLSDPVRKGKENKQQDKAAAGKKAVAPVTSGKSSATSKNVTGPAAPTAAAARTNHSHNNNNTNAHNNNISAGGKQQAAAAQTTKSTPRDGKPQPAVAQQAKQQQQRPAQQQAVATDQSAPVRRDPGVRAEDRQRPDRAAADGKSRPPRAPRPAPRDAGQAVDWSPGTQSQKEVDERKNRRNREDQNRGPLQNSNFAAPPDHSGGTGAEDRSPRGGGPRDRVFRRDRQPGRPAGNPRGPRNDNRDGRGKPVFDRHSGSEKSGVKAVEKRDGAGAHNWGTVNDDIAAQADAAETQKADTDAPAPAENQENQTAAETDEVKEPAEDAPKELTLAEYKRLTAAERRSQPKYNLRKANEGTDGAQFKKTYLLQKKKDDDESEYEEIEVITEVKESKKKVIDIEINFNETFRGGDDRRGGRGGRGRGGGGGGGRDGFRDRDRDRDRERDRDRDGGARAVAGDDRRKRLPVGPGRKQTAPKVDDVNDFPSLGVAA